MKHRSTTHLLMLTGILSLSTPALASESSQMPPPENVSASSTGVSTTSASPFKALERIPSRTKLTSAELAEYEGKWAATINQSLPMTSRSSSRTQAIDEWDLIFDIVGP